MTIDALKSKVHTMCGTSVSTMVLQLRDEGGKLLATLSDDARKLGFYSPHSGWVRCCCSCKSLCFVLLLCVCCKLRLACALKF
jgi:hypothetical protein